MASLRERINRLQPVALEPGQIDFDESERDPAVTGFVSVDGRLRFIRRPDESMESFVSRIFREIAPPPAPAGSLPVFLFPEY